MPVLELPRNLASGDLIAFANEEVTSSDGLMRRYTFAGSDYFSRMKELDLYTIDTKVLENKIYRLNLLSIYNDKLL